MGKSISVLVIISLFVVAYAQDNVCDDTLVSWHENPDDCQAFFMCMLSRRVDFRCDANFIFDASRRRCRLGSAETCEFRFGPEPSCEDQLLLFHHREDTCTEFFVCMLSRRIDFRCDEGDIFDLATRRCVRGDPFYCEVYQSPDPYKQIE